MGQTPIFRSFAAMKVFALFMTLLMLATGFDLCLDVEEEINKDNTELYTQANEDHEDEAPCLPFCHCARCPFSVAIPLTFTELLRDSSPGKKFPGITFATPVEFSASVWQPPPKSLFFS